MIRAIWKVVFSTAVYAFIAVLIVSYAVRDLLIGDGG